MSHKGWKYIFLFFVSCEGNEHFRSRSDYHFWNAHFPQLIIKLKKVNSDDFIVYNAQGCKKISSQENSTKKKSQSTKECSLEIELTEEEEDAEVVWHEKKINLRANDGKEFFLKISFSRQYQLINYEVGLGKIYHLKNISTDLPGADIKTDFKNKILYHSHIGENIIEIEY
ncbi:MAG: hypothetical protein LBD32_00090 [Cytophagales bacterium]|jgi:hypothetical protein|nr:hypothetical protein [Cytophagales bacterium]